MRVALTAHEGAREIVRLIQCPQCSKPFRNPVTLPCGRSLCKSCLPDTHQRENISYPDIPGRRQGLQCPFAECGREHPASDCNVDVVLTRVLDAVAEVVAKHKSVTEAKQTSMEEVVSAESVAEGQAMSEKSKVHQVTGSRLIATYLLAAQGELSRKTDLNYHENAESSETDRTEDINTLAEVLDATQKEVDCQVCYNLMLDPVTTFCGHTLCRKCFARVLDHSRGCPVCRRTLAIPPSLFIQPSNLTLTNLLNGLCPELVAARAEAVAAEESTGDGTTNVPFFVCTLSFPHQPTFLRIFEPRYRLMLRRCLEGNRQFGMLLYNNYNEPQGALGPVHFYQYGTMLEILQDRLLPDGTSYVETRGMYRFRVTAHWITDGYSVGNLERIDDVSLAEEERIEAEETSRVPNAMAEEDDETGTVQLERMSTQDLLAIGRDFIVRMQNRSAPWLQQRVLDVHGQPPDDAALFPYWFASVLPIREEEKYRLLGTRTVRERLKITASWIKRIEAARWVTTTEYVY